MKEKPSHARFIIAGGGTGGHVFPAIAIADALKAQCPSAEILFVGAQDRMEMQRVPEAGYEVVGLPIVGMPRRKNPIRLLRFLLRWMQCNRQAKRIIRKFGPDAIIGVGGYASVPVMQMGQRLGVPTFIQEQNGYAGVANRLLSRRAQSIFVAYPGMERFFPADRIQLLGNPVRGLLQRPLPSQAEARAEMQIPAQGQLVLIMGGSLGAATLNAAVLNHLDELVAMPNVMVLLQTGASHYAAAQEAAMRCPVDNLRVVDFIARMDLAYAAADIIVSRAGAISISELCIVGKPLVLVPSPNVAEDHQTKNAQVLASRGAAMLLPDAQAESDLLPTIQRLAEDASRMESQREQLKKLALPNASHDIAAAILSSITPAGK